MKARTWTITPPPFEALTWRRAADDLWVATMGAFNLRVRRGSLDGAHYHRVSCEVPQLMREGAVVASQYDIATLADAQRLAYEAALDVLGRVVGALGGGAL